MSSSYSAWVADSTHSSIVHEPDVSTTFLLDTNVLIDVVRGKTLQVPRNSNIMVSSLSLVELAAPNHMDVSVAEAILSSIGISDVVSVSRGIATLATELRKVQPLDVIDACIAATACFHDAILVTNDGKLLRHPVVMTSPFPIHLGIEDEIE